MRHLRVCRGARGAPPTACSFVAQKRRKLLRMEWSEVSIQAGGRAEGQIEKGLRRAASACGPRPGDRRVERPAEPRLELVDRIGGRKPPLARYGGQLIWRRRPVWARKKKKRTLAVWPAGGRKTPLRPHPPPTPRPNGDWAERKWAVVSCARGSLDAVGCPGSGADCEIDRLPASASASRGRLGAAKSSDGASERGPVPGLFAPC